MISLDQMQFDRGKEECPNGKPGSVLWYVLGKACGSLAMRDVQLLVTRSLGLGRLDASEIRGLRDRLTAILAAAEVLECDHPAVKGRTD